MSPGGYTCGCGLWVLYGSGHTCYYQYPYYTYTTTNIVSGNYTASDVSNAIDALRHEVAMLRHRAHASQKELANLTSLVYKMYEEVCRRDDEGRADQATDSRGSGERTTDLAVWPPRWPTV